MDTDMRCVIIECSQCKSFGPPHLNALLQPVHRCQPFDFITGNYVSLLKGKGRYKPLGVYIDTYSKFVWVQKLKSAGTGKLTVEGPTTISEGYAPACIFMANGGSHFVNKEVDAYYEKKGIKHITIPSYAPYINGLCKGVNKILLQRLQRLCAPDIDGDKLSVEPGRTPYNWPDHLEDAVRAMNDRIMPALLASLRELLFRMRLNCPFNALHNDEDVAGTTTENATTNFRLSEILCNNAHLRSLVQ
jgi:transposase InsO family protein